MIQIKMSKKKTNMVLKKTLIKEILDGMVNILNNKNNLSTKIVPSFLGPF